MTSDLQSSAPGLYDRPTVVAVDVAFNTAGVATGIDMGTLPAGTVVTRAWAEVLTAFNAATTNVLQIGYVGNLGAYLGVADITEGTPGVYPTGGKGPFAAETVDRAAVASYTQTGAAATAGTARCYLEYVRAR